MSESAYPGVGPNYDPKPLLRELTHKPGVYRMLDMQGTVIYVGKARNLRRRVGNYFGGRPLDSKTMAMLRQVADVEVTVTPTEAEALMLESNLIKEHLPRFNVLLRDDKSYPYIHVDTEHEFPRISFYRGSRKTAGKLFGPYPNAGAVRGAMNQLMKLFRIRGCEESYFANRTRPCLQHQIERCTAPCVGLISREDYARDVQLAILFLQGRSDDISQQLATRMEAASAELKFEMAAAYRDQLAELRQIQSQQLMSKSAGEIDVVSVVEEHGVYCAAVMFIRGGRSLGSRNYFPKQAHEADIEEVARAFVIQFYAAREAPREVLINVPIEDADAIASLLAEKSGRSVDIKWNLRGDRARLVQMCTDNAQHGAAMKSRSGATLNRQFEALGELLGLDSTPERMECFDISHTGGDKTVASCVVFASEGPVKSDYRHFNITGVTAGDDYAAMEQALMRRYGKARAGAASLPDVLVIDGGRGQLARAVEALGGLGLDRVTLVGVAKGEGRKAGREKLFLAGRKEPLRLRPADPALHLLQQIRDEAHRFAISGHRARKRKSNRQSPLEEIRGLGPKRRRELLRLFGGLQAISRAGVEDLMRVKGVSRQLAESIYERFHSS